METKFGSLGCYSSMDEVFAELKRLYGKFSLSISTDVTENTLTHVVFIRVLVAGKALDVKCEGTGNIAEIIKQAIIQLRPATMAVLNSKEVKGIPGIIKPIARVSEDLHQRETPTVNAAVSPAPVVLRPIHVAPSVVLRPIHVANEDDNENDNEDPCTGCPSYGTCPYNDDDEEDSDDEFGIDFEFDDEYEEYDEELDEEEEEESEFTRGQTVARGIKFVGTEENVKKEAASGLRFVGTTTNMNTDSQATNGSVIHVLIHEVIPAPAVRPETKKLCCELSRKRGYKFCPECGTQL